MKLSQKSLYMVLNGNRVIIKALKYHENPITLDYAPEFCFF